ncbi:AraC family transcriptional regulator, partial [Paenibacillus agaridevorans]
GDTARSVGYDDPLLFSKMFRKTMGMSPTEYRNTR